jgi:hypothetical protein
MNVWSKVILGFILVGSMVLFYLAVCTLAANRAWREAAKSYDPKLEQARKDIAQIEEGNETATPPLPRLSQLDVKLHDLMVGRGKVWRGCKANNLNPMTLELLIDVTSPDPHQIPDKMVLYVFEEGEGGQFIGEYKVAGLGDKQVSLLPTMMPPIPKMLADLKSRIGNTKSFWSLYEKLPTDRHDVFRGYSQEQLGQLMPGVPPEVLQEYLRDGTDKQAGDPDDRLVKGKYERPLRDYEIYLHELFSQIAQLRDQIAAASNDKALGEKLKADTEMEVQARQALIDKTLKPELDKAKGELAVITGHRNALQEKLAAVSTKVDETLAENKRLLKRWTAIQVGSAKRLNELIERDTSSRASSYTGE